MMALQPADAPEPAVCSLVALEGHDGRGALKWPLLHTMGWDPLRGSKFGKRDKGAAQSVAERILFRGIIEHAFTFALGEFTEKLNGD